MTFEFVKKCLKNLKAFQLGGEVFSGELYNKLIKYTSAKIYNGYGPAEVSACSSNKLVLSSDNINIGRPINNIKILILNKNIPSERLSHAWSSKGKRAIYLKTESQNMLL